MKLKVILIGSLFLFMMAISLTSNVVKCDNDANRNIKAISGSNGCEDKGSCFECPYRPYICCDDGQTGGYLGDKLTAPC